MLLKFIPTKREDFVIDVKAGDRHGCSEHEIMGFSIFYGGNRAASEIAAMTGEELTLVLSGVCLKDTVGEGPRGKNVSRELVNIQVSFPPGSRILHPHGQDTEQKGQETCMDEQGTPVKTQM